MCSCLNPQIASFIFVFSTSLFKLVCISLQDFNILLLNSEKKCSTWAYWGVYSGRKNTTSNLSFIHLIVDWDLWIVVLFIINTNLQPISYLLDLMNLSISLKEFNILVRIYCRVMQMTKMSASGGYTWNNWNLLLKYDRF